MQHSCTQKASGFAQSNQWTAEKISYTRLALHRQTKQGTTSQSTDCRRGECLDPKVLRPRNSTGSLGSNYLQAANYPLWGALRLRLSQLHRNEKLTELGIRSLQGAWHPDQPLEWIWRFRRIRGGHEVRWAILPSLTHPFVVYYFMRGDELNEWQIPLEEDEHDSITMEPAVEKRGNQMIFHFPDRRLSMPASMRRAISPAKSTRTSTPLW